MDVRITQPTKEQVRAYMARRERDHRPPPAPEDIRRQLGWDLAPPEPVSALIGFCLLPATLTQYAARIVLDWCLAPLRLHSYRQEPLPLKTHGLPLWVSRAGSD
jgi:hypothetical protein